MADLVVGLAKSVVEGALTKAQSAIEEEARLRKGAQRDLVFITGEFEMMHSFLKVAKVERVENEVVRTWVRQVRELAYDVEDCIEFVIHLEAATTCTWWFRMISCMSPTPLPLDKAVDEIEQLKARVKDVSTRNARYSLIGDTGSKPVKQQETPTGTAVDGETTSNMLAEARDTTKRQQAGLRDLAQLITKKDDDPQLQLQVISVWGAGGDHGITSIIRKAYNDPEICRNFTCRAWVKLMHPFNPDEFVRGFMAQVYANDDSVSVEQGTTKGMQVLTKMAEATEAHVLYQEFEQKVTREKYLIVLEDLSDMVEWDAIRTFLPGTNNGSWIIVSAQQPEIASLCIGHSYQILELKQFSPDHSVCALFKKGSQGDGDYKGKEAMVRMNLIGRESQMNELRKYPANALINSYQVVSVWGITGVGKSALVTNFYCDLMNDSHQQFNHYSWVDVSHPFNLRDFCRSLLSDFHSDKDPIKQCRELLKQRRCLIVIDDLRSKKEWDLIQASLLPRHPMGVIIVITTDASIATYCTNGNKELIFNVKGLEAAAALELLKVEVLKKNPQSPLKAHGAAEVEELVSKCGGLPKIIVAIAGLLATQTVTLMHTVCCLNRGFMHHLETKPEYDSLQGLFVWMHSYFRTCPDSLKPCIFYLSIFPRDHIIRRRRLVRRWIAEGYSRDGDDESAEENGEKHFSELLDLSIIQQLPQSVMSTATSSDTRMVLCQVNGFIREYIVSRRMEENLVFELGSNCALTTQRRGRHLIILKDWVRDRILFGSIDFSRLRSLTVLGTWESFFISESMGLLRVLDLEDASGVTDEDLENTVKWLCRLKFLSLRGHREICHLPSSLGDLRQLQTLDVRDTSIVTLPASITKLQKLQYIRAGTNDVRASASCTWFCRCRRLVGVEVPKGIGKLTAMHTLGIVNVSASRRKTFLKELAKLTQLRKLGVSGINKRNSKEFFRAISGHGHLQTLSVRLDKDSHGCLDKISLPWEKIQSLKLYGLGDKLPLSTTLPQNVQSNHVTKLTKLDLEMDTLTDNDMKFLAELPELYILRLCVKQLPDGKLHIYTEAYETELSSYKNVKILEIACSSSLHITFGSKTLKNLELLKLDCSGLPGNQISGISHLSELKEVLIKGTNDEAMKADLKSQLDNHPKENKPVLNLQS